MTFEELCGKEVVQVESGVCLGRIDDAEFDPVTAMIGRFVLLGRPKLFGLLGREPSLVIEWQDVVRFGVDAILVKTPLNEAELTKKRHFLRFW